MNLKIYKGKKVAVVGIGVSNIPLIKFLVKLGAKCNSIWYEKRKSELGEVAQKF